ncbi:WecB/TagA/CpsF family glycosyltransferase [Halomonas denitrificans]|uniref:WecB/TagA/CpsF family glycosyltransferase n=1 Tax=Halomonas denitrificans TaxID=370769 RepID=UPI0013005324|nr:WecB/TagA/CpsF family glycosyltransferase [Halomonas denitrificans]
MFDVENFASRRKFILNTPFDYVDKNGLVACILKRIEDGGTCVDVVITPNVDHVLRVNKDPSLREVYNSAWLSVCDSRVLEFLVKIRGHEAPCVFPGSEIVASLVNDKFFLSRKVAVIGGSQDVVSEFKRRFHFQSLFHHNPPMGFINSVKETNECIDFVLGVKPDVIFLAVGSPQQEQLAYKLKQQGGIGALCLCVGASILFLTGHEKRAPRIVKSMRLEWLYRLFRNPRRLWKRYLSNFKIFPLMFTSNFKPSKEPGVPKSGSH